MGEKGIESGTGSAVGSGSSQFDPGSASPGGGPSGTGGGEGPANQAIGGSGGGGGNVGTPPSPGDDPNTLRGAMDRLGHHNP